MTIAGRWHLGYELYITNFRPVAVELLRVDVMDAARDIRLASFTGTQLAEKLSRVGTQVEGAERQRVPAGGRAIVFVWLPLEQNVATPARLQHTIELDLMRPTGRVRTVVTDTGSVVRSAPPLAADGIPYVFRNFEVLGAYESVDAFTTGERWRPFPAATGKRGMELPAANTVVMFPGARE